MKPELHIRPATLGEMPILLDWAAREGWNPGLHDAMAFHAADPQGFLVGWIGDAPVACISAVRHAPDFGFIGFYIVRPESRGQGHGWTIWQAGMARLASCNVALDGVLAEQDNYRRSGFRLAWRNLRYQGLTAPAAPLPAGGLLQAVPLAQVDPQALQAFDSRHFPCPRGAFLREWIRQPGTVALGLVQGGRLQALGVIRPCRSGYKVGPLNATTPQAAQALFEQLQARVPPGQPLFLDLPEPNPQALALAQRQGMQPVFETARMYTAGPPALALQEVYGITSFELG